MNHTPAMFRDLHPPLPDDLDEQYQDLRRSIERAEGSAELALVIESWEAVRRASVTWGCWVALRYAQDTTCEARQQAQAKLDAWQVHQTERENQVKWALLSHPASRELGIGEHVFEMWDVDRKVSSEETREFATRENQISSAYTKLMASMRVDWDGGRLTLAGLTPHLSDPDRATRRRAYGLLDAWMIAHAEELDDLFAELVSLRHQMARALGYSDYVEMGYDRRRRIGYGPRDVAVWRAEILERVVPVARALRSSQAEKLGVERLMAWDREIHDPVGNPKPSGDEAWMIDRAREMFDALDAEELGPFFRLLSERGYMDLEGRSGKAGGGFCMGFPTERMPFIFANFNGSMGDARVFTHEVGHAFQFWKSAEYGLYEYMRPTADTAEMHSMSLEFLVWPHLEKLFGDQAERFRRLHLTERLTFLPYGVAVDHFQHLVYSHPEATPHQRLDMWREMEATYLPTLDWGDIDYGSQGRRWQLQRHIYKAPFYYIEYTLAQAVAMQFWDLSGHDPEVAMSRYKALCARGGSAPFEELIDLVGFKSPFKPGSLEETTNKATAYLGL